MKEEKLLDKYFGQKASTATLFLDDHSRGADFLF